MKHTGKLGVVFLILACFVAYLILVENGLAQDFDFPETEDGISVTPPIWLETKYMKWNGSWYDYYVYGWWFTDGDYWHLGDYREFQVTYEVYSEQVLIPDGTGHTDKNLCKLGFIDNDPFASMAACVLGSQSFLPFVWRNGR